MKRIVSRPKNRSLGGKDEAAKYWIRAKQCGPGFRPMEHPLIARFIHVAGKSPI